MTAAEHYQAGELDKAIEAAIQTVKAKPMDVPARFFLAELLCFAGDLERADRQLDTLMQQSPEMAMRLGLFRQLIRGETARQQLFSEGRPPEVLAEPDERMRLHLEASIAFRERHAQEAVAALERAEELRPKLAGSCDGKAFDDFRDLDDLLAGYLEVLTSNGKYYWVPLETVQKIEFAAPERAMDLIWRNALISVEGGPDGSVYIPVIYPGTTAGDDAQLKLGRGTDWIGGDSGPIRGVGQRMFLVGDEARPIMQMKCVEMTPTGN